MQESTEDRIGKPQQFMVAEIILVSQQRRSLLAAVALSRPRFHCDPQPALSQRLVCLKHDSPPLERWRSYERSAREQRTATSCWPQGEP